MTRQFFTTGWFASLSERIFTPHSCVERSVSVIINRPTKYKFWDMSAMAGALSAVEKGESVRRATEMYNVPKSTLSDRITGCRTFSAHSHCQDICRVCKVFLPFLFNNYRDLGGLTTDRYLSCSIKESTRGSGLRTKVSSHTRLPRKWGDFLRDARNKKELYSFLTDTSVYN